FFLSSDAPAPTVLDTLSLHDALPISCGIFHRPGSLPSPVRSRARAICLLADREIHWDLSFSGSAVRLSTRPGRAPAPRIAVPVRDRKSTRLNSSHVKISYAVFCLKKK